MRNNDYSWGKDAFVTTYSEEYKTIQKIIEKYLTILSSDFSLREISKGGCNFSTYKPLP